MLRSEYRGIGITTGFDFKEAAATDESRIDGFRSDGDCPRLFFSTKNNPFDRTRLVRT